MSGRKRRATFEDDEDVSINCVGELIGDTLFSNSRPLPAQARAISRLAALLGTPFDLGEGGPGGWVILVEPELHLGDDVFVANLAGWRRERMPEMPKTEIYTVVPDWICEVLSPATVELNRDTKRACYAREGVGHLWFVDPFRQSLEAYQLEDRIWTLRGTWRADDFVQAEPFTALTLRLTPLWEW